MRREAVVERVDGSWRCELDVVHNLPDTLAELNPRIDSFQQLYSTFRPRGVLQDLAPAHYFLGPTTGQAAPASRLKRLEP